jgi:hypothetical protein
MQLSRVTAQIANAESMLRRVVPVEEGIIRDIDRASDQPEHG